MKKKINLLCVFCALSLMITGCSSKENVLSTTTTYSYDGLTYDVPSSFEVSDMSDLKIYSWDDYEGERKNLCKFEVSSMVSYGLTAEQYAYNNISFMAPSQDAIKTFTTTIGGENWAVVEITKEKAKYNSYAIVKDDVVYILQYNDVGSGDICEQALDIILNSVKFN